MWFCVRMSHNCHSTRIIKSLFMLFAYNVFLFLCIAEGYQCVKADVCERLYGQCVSIVVLCGDAHSLLGGWGSGESTCSNHLQPFPKNISRNYAVLPMFTSSLWHHTGHIWPHQQSPALTLEADLLHGPPKDKCPISREKCLFKMYLSIKNINKTI